MEALVEECGELLGGVVGGEVGAAYVAYEESVAGEDGSGVCGLGEVGEDGADAFDGVPGSVEEVEPGIAELEGVAVLDWGVGEGRVRVLAEVDAGAGALGELVVAGDKVGVEVGLDDVLDLQIVLLCELDIQVNVALRIDHGGDALGGDEVGGVGEAAEKELFDAYGFHFCLSRVFAMILLESCYVALALG